jgi:hypothetical protein
MTAPAEPLEPELVSNLRHYRYYDLVMAGFVTVLLCSNLIGPGKTCILFGVTFGAGNLFFPISYIFGDVLTEVYGYARTRKVIWAGFSAIIFATIMGLFVIHLPADPEEPFNAVIQPALEVVFESTWRVMVASIVAFWCGELCHGEDEGLDRGASSLDPHDRFDCGRPTRRQHPLLSDCFPRDLAARTDAEGYRLQLEVQGLRRNPLHAGDLRDRWLAEAPGK